MGNFTLTIYTGNDAMQTLEDIARALETVTKKLRNDSTGGFIYDENGNRVGTFDLTD